MDRELLIECIALLNTANFKETLSDKRNEVVYKLKEQLRIGGVMPRVSGSFTADDVERAYDDGYQTEGEVTFDIENYR